MSLLLDLLRLAATPEPRALSTAEATGVAVHLAIVTLKLAIAAALRRVQTHEGARVGSRHPDALSAGGDAERNGGEAGGRATKGGLCCHHARQGPARHTIIVQP